MAGSTVVIEWLRQVPLFSACSARELRAIAGVVKEVDHPRGTVVATEGDPGVGLFVIVDGGGEDEQLKKGEQAEGHRTR